MFVKNTSRLSVALLASCLSLGSVSAANASDTLYFGIVPQQAASKLAKMWMPFIRELGEQTGQKIRFATMKDIPTFEKCLAQGAYDIAYMNPYHYTVFSKRSGYRAIAHQSEKKLKGLIVVKQDDPATRLADLNGEKVAFPSPAAFGASVLPRAEMKVEGLDIEPIYVKSHDSVYISVANGLMRAGGGVMRTFNSIPEDLRKQLRVIYTTKAYTPHAFAVHPKMDSAQSDALFDAMQKITAEKPELVKGIGMKGFDKATDKTWDDVRKLGLTQDETDIVQQGDVKCRFD